MYVLLDDQRNVLIDEIDYVTGELINFSSHLNELMRSIHTAIRKRASRNFSHGTHLRAIII